LYIRAGSRQSSPASLPGFASYFHCFTSLNMSRRWTHSRLLFTKLQLLKNSNKTPLSVVPNSYPLGIKRFVPSISISFTSECYIIMYKCNTHRTLALRDLNWVQHWVSRIGLFIFKNKETRGPVCVVFKQCTSSWQNDQSNWWWQLLTVSFDEFFFI